jgi:hypothetical protein
VGRVDDHGSPIDCAAGQLYFSVGCDDRQYRRGVSGPDYYERRKRCKLIASRIQIPDWPAGVVRAATVGNIRLSGPNYSAEFLVRRRSNEPQAYYPGRRSVLREQLDGERRTLRRTCRTTADEQHDHCGSGAGPTKKRLLKSTARAKSRDQHMPQNS